MGQSLEGTVERISFANEESGWSAIRVSVSGRAEVVTAVGHLFGVQPGEALHLMGEWVTDPKYGEQFKAESFLPLQPTTVAGIERYLGSGRLPGLGRVMAERLVRRFGLETLEVIERRPDRLAEVEGIGPKRSELICRAWTEQKEVREVMIFLQSNGVPGHFAAKIYKRYGKKAVAQVREDPYRLAEDIFGIGFASADRLAQAMGMARDAPARANAGLLHQLRSRAQSEGDLYMPVEALIQQSCALLGLPAEALGLALERLVADGRVVRDSAGEGKGAIYLPHLHRAEHGTADKLSVVLSTAAKTRTVPELEQALEWYRDHSGVDFAPEQREAFRRAAQSKVLVITGGPGTGKTTLIRGLVEIFSRLGLSVLLAAPTGRAAKRLAEATGREARTLHRLLELRPGTGSTADPPTELDCDLLVVDEASMVDAQLAYQLCRALQPSTRIVWVGDVDQLPSVGPGRVLHQLIASGECAVVRLERVFRQAEESGIVTAAHRINSGRLPAGPGQADGDFLYLERSSPEAILETVKTLVSTRIPRHFGVDPIDGVQVLAPMHRGLLGTAHLNQMLQELLGSSGETVQRHGRTFRTGDKVMQLRNNYELDVFNGDLGRVRRIDEEEQRLTVDFDGRSVEYDFAELEELALAYACSIHKAQGSEYPCVVLPLHGQHRPMLQRNLLYTAVTRAKRLMVIVGSRDALARAVSQVPVGERRTRLGLLLHDRMERRV